MVDPIYEPGFETEDNDSKKENKESKKNGKNQDGDRKDGDRKDGDRKEGRDGECSATTRTTYIIVDGSSEEKKEGKSLERFA